MSVIAGESKIRIRKILSQGAMFLWVVLCLYLVISLLSFDNGDAGWSITGSNDYIQNAGGQLGALLADICYSLIGYMAGLIPLLILLKVIRLFRQSGDEECSSDWIDFTIHSSGAVLMMISGTIIAEYNWSQSTWLGFEMPMGSGGILGSLMAGTALSALGNQGANLILFSIFLFGITIFTDLSWLKIADKLGVIILNFYQKQALKVKQKMELRRREQQHENVIQKREASLAPKREKFAKRAPARIEPLVEKNEIGKNAEQQQVQTSLFASTIVPGMNSLPDLDLLESSENDEKKGYSPQSLEALSKQLELKLADFGIQAEVMSILPGPVVTRFEIQPAAGVKASRITSISSDIARSLAVISVRVVEVIPGKSFVGIEIPNEQREMVRLRDIVASKIFEESASPLTLAMGHDISGMAVVADLGKMPHTLVAGTTGSGKSVAVNAMLLSLLYKATPEQVRLILIDPKMLELSVYEGIPHLLTPVITDMKDAANGLRWSVGEMERRYKLMAQLGVRNLTGYNRKVKEAINNGEPMQDPLWKPSEADITYYQSQGEDVPHPTLETLPSIVIVIDEFADMMMIVGKKVEQLIARIAQKARAAGIHLVLATQRPSVDVITGLIKANIPTRMAFQVSSRIDSRTILDQGGAEQLLGHGDMLFLPAGTSVPQRVHGAFVDDHEVHKVVSDWKARGEPQYLEAITDEASVENIMVPGVKEDGGSSDDNGETDSLYDEAVEFVCQSRKASISSVQRKLRVGYNRAARLIETMEEAGLVSPMGSNGNREVLAPSPGE